MRDEEPFKLGQPKREMQPAGQNDPARQRKLFSGMGCLPGQTQMFETDGPRDLAEKREDQDDQG